MCDTATVLHADYVAHGVVHVHDRVEQGRLQVGRRHAISHTKLVELPKQHLKADHCLCEVCSIEGIDAIGANDTTLDLDLAQARIIYRLAREEACFVDGFGGDVEEVVWENLLTILDHLDQLLLFQFFPRLCVSFNIVVDVHGSELRWHAFV